MYADTNPFEIANTLLKMAKKRALIDAVLSATRSSDLFTQDMEDLDLSKKGTTPKPTPKSAPQKDPVKVKPTPTAKEISASRQQLTEIYSVVVKRHFPIEEIRKLIQERYHVSASKFLSFSQANDLKQYLTSPQNSVPTQVV